MAERFELIGTQGDISGHLRLAYGSAPDDLTPFVITLTPQYVARAIGKMPPAGGIRRTTHPHLGDTNPIEFGVLILTPL